MAAFKSFVATTMAFSLFGSAAAHMMLASPQPFGPSVGLTTSPLTPDGSNYPCQVGSKNGDEYTMTAINKIPVNEPVLLAFSGSATHEGGTCELAISMDHEPTANSVFKVIQVFEGGCPIAPSAGNMTFNIPKDFPSVDRATLSWSWFNKVGNREIYQNCAPIQITGGSNDKSYYDSLPNMFIANVKTPQSGSGGECTTVEGSDTEIPNPGQFIVKDASAKPGSATGAGCAAAASAQLSGVKNYQSKTVSNFASYSAPAKDANHIIPQGGAASGSASGYGGGAAATSSPNNGMYTQAPAISSAAVPGSSAYTAMSDSDGSTTSAATSAAVSATDAPSSLITMVTSGQPAATATASAYPTLTLSAGAGVSGPATGAPAAAPTGYSSTSGSGSSAGSSSGSSSSGNITATCSDNGSVVCNGPQQFGLCNNGQVVWQAVAAGTICQNGSIQKRSSFQIRGSSKARRAALEGALALRKESLGLSEKEQ